MKKYDWARIYLRNRERKYSGFEASCYTSDRFFTFVLKRFDQIIS